MLRIDQTPAIEVHLIKSGEPPGGIGETGTTAAPPAICNAIFAATGVRAAPLADRPRRSRRDGNRHERLRPATLTRVALCGGRRRRVVALVLIGFFMIVHGPGATDFAGGKRVALADYHGANPTGVPRRARRSRLRRSAANIWRVPPIARRATPPRAACPIAGGLRFQAAVRHALFHQHHARQGHRHRRLHRRGFPQSAA